MITLLRKEIRAQWRTHRVLIVAALLLLFGLTSPLLVRYLPDIINSLGGLPPEFAELIPPPSVGDAIAQYIKNLTQFGIVLALLVPMGAVVREKERGTAAMLLSKPVSRASFLLAKFAALALTFLTGLVLAGLGGYYYSGVLFEWLDLGRFSLLNGLLWLYFLVYVALTLLASTLARSQVAAGGMAFVLYLLLLVPESIPPLGNYLPGAVVMWGGRLALGQAGDPAWVALGVSLGLIAAALLGAWGILRGQEI